MLSASLAINLPQGSHQHVPAAHEKDNSVTYVAPDGVMLTSGLAAGDV